MNVIVLVADALRADHLSCYGYERETTPTIDSFAADNIRYEKAYTPATWTRSAAASILTGTYPSVHGVKTIDDYFGSDLVRWPEVLSDEGYRTVGISAIGNVSSGLGFGRGFDNFVDLYKETRSHRTESTVEEEMMNHESGTIGFPTSAQVFERFEDLVLNQSDDSPFFSLLWTIDPHDPYHPPTDFEKYLDPDYNGFIDGSRESLRRASSSSDFQRLIDLYDSEISYLDHTFENFVELLKENQSYEDTLLLFVGDHGEAFGEHNGNVGHSHVPYEELIHIPIIARYPEETPNWTGESQFVSLVDLMPTTLDYMDIETPQYQSNPRFGQSVLQEGKKRVFSETHYADVQNTYYSLRDGKWKLIKTESPNNGLRPYVSKLFDKEFMIQVLRNPTYFVKRRFGETSEKLFNMSEDPEEQNNLINDAEVADDLKDELTEWRKRLTEHAGGRESISEIDDQTEDQLRKMGYIE